MRKVHTFQSSEKIMEEAYGWVLKFNSDTPPGKDDVAALREWSSRPAHRQALKEAEDFWCEAELLSQLAVPLQKKPRGGLSAFFSAVVGVLPFSGGTGSMVFIRSAVLASLLFLGLGVVFVWRPVSINESLGNGIYSTVIGEQTTITLVDNTKVQLDTNSEIRVAYGERIRKIHLLSGKAHFDVAKNPVRPFEVYAREGLVRAVGTAFSVYLAEDNVEVVVDEGRVDLARLLPGEDDGTPLSEPAPINLVPVGDSLPSNNNAAVTGVESLANLPSGATLSGQPEDAEEVFLSLERGQSAQFDQEQELLVQLSVKDLDKALAWRKGVLTFAGDPLGEIVYEVSRYTDTTIEITDPALRDLLMGGRFRVGELDALFEVLELGFGVKVSYLSEYHVQLSLASNE